jgi:hypothetical protein
MDVPGTGVRPVDRPSSVMPAVTLRSVTVKIAVMRTMTSGMDRTHTCASLNLIPLAPCARIGPRRPWPQSTHFSRATIYCAQ